MTRRGFISLGTGIAAGATAGAMISCSDPVSSEKTSQSVCKKTVQLSHSDIVNAVACSPGGSLMASGSGDNTIKLSVSDGSLLKKLKGPLKDVKSVAISPDGKLLVGGSRSSTSTSGLVYLWQLPEGSLIKIIQAHSHEIRQVAFGMHGSILISLGDERTIQFRNPADYELIKTLSEKSIFSDSIAVSADGKKMATGYWMDIKLWSLPDGTYDKTLTGHSDGVHSLDFCSDNNMLVSGSRHTIKTWNTETGEMINIFVDPACEIEMECDDTNYSDYSCTCDNIRTCTCDKVCTCDTVCNSDGSSSCGGSYWYPN